MATPTNDTNYKTGDLIYTLTAGDVQGVLMTPGLQTASGQCSNRNPAKFLEDSSVTCRRDIKTVIDAECVGNSKLLSIGHVNEYSTMYYSGIPRHTQSMLLIAYEILTEYFWKFQ